MSETYKFYVQMDGQTYGPYSARAVKDLDLPDDILVTEESMNGKWLAAGSFDFDDMVRKEEGIDNTPSQPVNVAKTINPDGTVTSPNGWQSQPVVQSQYQQPYQPQYQPQNYPYPANNDDNSSPVGWCILAFLIPLVGWILYFSWKRNKPKKASAVCTWAWIGFVLNIIIMCAGM